MKSVLADININEVTTTPFPYIAKVGCVIDRDLCKKLIDEYPSLDVLSRGSHINGRVYESNEKIRFFAKDVRESNISPLWKEFVEAHLTKEHYAHVLRLFKPSIKKLYPNLALEDLRFGIRHIDTFEDVDVLMDAEICIDTPVQKPSAVKVAHLDSVRKLFVGNFYLRRSDDDSVGGALELFKYKSNKFHFYGRRYVKDKYVDKITEVPYETNNLGCFINSLHSLHGVEERQKTQHSRYSFNFIIEFKDPLFSIEEYVHMTPKRFIEKFKVKAHRFINTRL